MLLLLIVFTCTMETNAKSDVTPLTDVHLNIVSIMILHVLVCSMYITVNRYNMPHGCMSFKQNHSCHINDRLTASHSSLGSPSRGYNRNTLNHKHRLVSTYVQPSFQGRSVLVSKPFLWIILCLLAGSWKCFGAYQSCSVAQTGRRQEVLVFQNSQITRTQSTTYGDPRGTTRALVGNLRPLEGPIGEIFGSRNITTHHRLLWRHHAVEITWKCVILLWLLWNVKINSRERLCNAHLKGKGYIWRLLTMVVVVLTTAELMR